MADALSTMFKIIPLFGSIYFAIVVLVFLWLKKDKKLSINFILAFILTNAIVYGLKFLFQIPRPSSPATLTSLPPFYDTSFPSTHSARAFVYFTFISQKFDKFFLYVSYILAALVAVSRVRSGDHTAIDVIVGSAIGIAVGYLFTKYQHQIFDKLGLSKVF